MDPICHTLVGAALGEAGLGRRTPLAVPTLLIGANLPDVDVAAYVAGRAAALSFRRGWTHGVAAMVVLPLALTGIMLLADRIATWRRPGRAPSRWGDVLLLSVVSVATHPLLDFLNTYGVRWLMPFSDRWFYGDALFIVDPWLWGGLAVGVVWSRRRRRRGAGSGAEGRITWEAGPARLALGAAVAYALAMGVLGRIGRGVVGREAAAAGLGPARVMVGPLPATPLAWQVLIEAGGAYRAGRLEWLPPGYAPEGPPIPRHADHPAARAAAATPEGRQFLGWSRFPYYLIDSSTAGAYQVWMGDARYNADWASVTVVVPRAD